MSLRGMSMFSWVVLKCGIGTVLYWRPPDVHIFGTDSFLLFLQPPVRSTNSRLLVSDKEVYVSAGMCLFFLNNSKCCG